MDHNMVFSYNYGKQKKEWQKTNAPTILAILMATAVHRSKTDGIAQCGMSRATLEATGRHHWATICSILPRGPPGKQAHKQQSTNTPTLLAILMAAVVHLYVTMHMRSRALVEATGHRHWARIVANRCNCSCNVGFFQVF
jgi:hypothetical protein